MMQPWMMQQQQQHRRGRSLSGVVKEKDEDLALFHEMQKREQVKKDALRSLGISSAPKAVNPCINTRIPTRMRGVDDIFTADSEKNDYDWLLTPPGTPLFSSLNHDALGLESPLKALRLPRLALRESSSKLVPGSLGRQPRANSSFSATNLSSRQTSNISISGRSSLGSRQLNSNFSNSSNMSSRQLTSNLSSSNSTYAPNRTSSLAPIPVTRATSRPSTPTGRTSIPSTTTRSASSSRPSTPTRRPATPTLRPSYPPTSTTTRSSSVSKTSSLPSRYVPSSRGSSPITRTRPWEPSAMPGFSLDPPPNLRTTVQERSSSNQRGSSISSRPGAPTGVRTSQSEMPDVSNRSRRPSSSPSVTRGRLITGSQSRDTMNIRNAKMTNSSVDVATPVVLGGKTFEKAMRVRSPASSPDDQINSVHKSQIKNPVKQNTPVARDTSGFGRNLSKKSLDMALRHMDIRRSTSNGFRPLISNVPASSLYSVRAGTGRPRPASSVTDSPLATSSNTSSDYSMSILQEREGSDLGDEASSGKRGKVSPVSQLDSALKDARISNWIRSPDYRNDSVDLIQLLKQGIEKSFGSEFPLLCENTAASEMQ